MNRKRNTPLPPPPDLPPSAWVTAREVAALRRTAVSTVWLHAARGLIPRPTYFSPRTPRWRVADVTPRVSRTERETTEN